MAEQLDRRRFLRRAGVASGAAGALWVTPSVVGLDTTWAASGPCGALPDLSFVAGGTLANPTGVDPNPANNNGWTYAATGMKAAGAPGALGVMASWGALSDTFVVERDPLAPTTSAQVTYSHSLGTLVAGRTYTFHFSIWDRRVNQYTQELQVEVISPTATVTTIASYATGNPPAVTQLVDATTSNVAPTFTPPTGGVYTLEFVFTFPFSAAPLNATGDDIGITAPVVTCA